MKRRMLLLFFKLNTLTMLSYPERAWMIVVVAATEISCAFRPIMMVVLTKACRWKRLCILHGYLLLHRRRSTLLQMNVNIDFLSSYNECIRYHRLEIPHSSRRPILARSVWFTMNFSDSAIIGGNIFWTTAFWLISSFVRIQQSCIVRNSLDFCSIGYRKLIDWLSNHRLRWLLRLRSNFHGMLLNVSVLNDVFEQLLHHALNSGYLLLRFDGYSLEMKLVNEDLIKSGKFVSLLTFISLVMFDKKDESVKSTIFFSLLSNSLFFAERNNRWLSTVISFFVTHAPLIEYVCSLA